MGDDPTPPTSAGCCRPTIGARHMSEKTSPQIDQTASESIKRIETQLRLDGKLNTAIATEGAAVLAIAAGVVACCLLGVLGFSDEFRGIAGTGVIMATIVWIAVRMARNGHVK